MDRLFILAVTVAAATGGPTQSPTPSPAAGEHTSLSGRWRFNPEQSEDARKKVNEAMAARQAGGSGSGGGGGGYGGGHRGGGGYGGGHGGGRMGGGGGTRPPSDSPDTMASLLEATPEMTITHTEAEIAVLEKDGRLRTLHPDGQKYKTDTGGEVKTRWDNDRLIVETKRDRGPSVTETLGLSADRKQLVSTLRLEGRSFGPVTVRRVYDAEAAE
jgi:hypothetical protein